MSNKQRRIQAISFSLLSVPKQYRRTPFRTRKPLTSGTFRTIEISNFETGRKRFGRMSKSAVSMKARNFLSRIDNTAGPVPKRYAIRSRRIAFSLGYKSDFPFASQNCDKCFRRPAHATLRIGSFPVTLHKPLAPYRCTAHL